MNKTVIINSPFSIEASPPSLNSDLYNIRYNLKQIYENVEVIDLDSKTYMFLKEDYDLIYYLLGGYPFSYPTNSFIPINVYPFETLPTGGLILDILLNIDYKDNLLIVANQLGLDYDIALIKMNRFLSFIKKEINTIKEYDNIIFCSDSIVSSVMSYYISKKCDINSKYAMGKNYFVPDLKKMLSSYCEFDKLFRNKYELFKYLKIEKVSDTDYDFSGLERIPYEFGQGMMHILLNCGRGCPNKCNFCSIRLDWDEKNIYDKLYEDSNKIISEKIDNIYNAFGIAYIHIGMCTFNANLKKTYGLLDILKSKKALFSTNLTVKNLSNEFIEKMRVAHFYKVIIGVESINKDMLNLMNKGKDNDYNTYLMDVLRIKRKFEICNVISQMNVLLFYPGQTKEQTEAIINDWEILFKELNKENILINNIPIGTLCLNYPSKMYKEVIENKDFKIVYHSANLIQREQKQYLKMIEYYENIPYYAIYGNAVLKDNKLSFINYLKSLEVHNSEKDAEFLLNQCFSLLDEIYNIWMKNAKKLGLNEQKLNRDIKKLIKFDERKSHYISEYTYNSDEEKEQFILMILYLMMNNICYIY